MRDAPIRHEAGPDVPIPAFVFGHPGVLISLGEESNMMALANNDECKLKCNVLALLLRLFGDLAIETDEGFLDTRNLCIHDLFILALADTISVEENTLR